jgi:hypothetical protein
MVSYANARHVLRRAHEMLASGAAVVGTDGDPARGTGSAGEPGTW